MTERSMNMRDLIFKRSNNFNKPVKNIKIDYLFDTGKYKPRQSNNITETYKSRNNTGDFLNTNLQQMLSNFKRKNSREQTHLMKESAYNHRKNEIENMFNGDKPFSFKMKENNKIKSHFNQYNISNIKGSNPMVLAINSFKHRLEKESLYYKTNENNRKKSKNYFRRNICPSSAKSNNITSFTSCNNSICNSINTSRNTSKDFKRKRYYSNFKFSVNEDSQNKSRLVNLLKL